MKDIKFPLKFIFKVGTLANDFRILDADERIIGFVRMKLFKWKENIQVFSDETRTDLLYSIQANKWLDFNSAYAFKNEKTGDILGKVVRKGMKSIWKAEYSLIDQHDKQQYTITEKNPWVKVIDSIAGEIPVLSMFTGYLFNPSYHVLPYQEAVKKDTLDEIVLIKKDPSFFGRKFSITKIKDIDKDDQERVMLGLMMMVLLERGRG